MTWKGAPASRKGAPLSRIGIWEPAWEPTSSRRGGSDVGWSGGPCGRPRSVPVTGTLSHLPPAGGHKGPHSSSAPLPPLRDPRWFAKIPIHERGCPIGSLRLAPYPPRLNPLYRQIKETWLVIEAKKLFKVCG